jgi:predicted anti-sigma-YlaC factor YlaD
VHDGGGRLGLRTSNTVRVAVALLLAAWNPLHHAGIAVFAIILWVLHSSAHEALILGGVSPGQYQGAVAESWVGAALLLAFYPRAAARS